MDFKFQCPDTGHSFFSFFEPFHNWFPGTHTEKGASHPRCLPTSLAYSLHETYQETAASKEESSPTSVIKWVSGRWGISPGGSNPGSAAVLTAKRHKIHTPERYLLPAPSKQLRFLSLPALAHVHACSPWHQQLQLHFVPTRAWPRACGGTGRTGHQRPGEPLCSHCISILHRTAHSKYAARLHTGWWRDTAL